MTGSSGIEEAWRARQGASDGKVEGAIRGVRAGGFVRLVK
jgi:hypothetical protein